MMEENQCPLLNCLNKPGMLWVHYKQFFVDAVAGAVVAVEDVDVEDVVAVEDVVDVEDVVGPNAVAVD